MEYSNGGDTSFPNRRRTSGTEGIALVLPLAQVVKSWRLFDKRLSMCNNNQQSY